MFEVRDEKLGRFAGNLASGNFAVYLALAALLSIHLFVCSALSVIGLGANDIPELAAYLWVGTMLFQPGLVACWFALGMGRIFFRLATLLILISSFAVADLWGVSWNAGGSFKSHDLSNGVIFPGACLTQSILLYVLRSRNWRMVNPFVDEAATGAESSRSRFTTAQLMYFIAVASVPLALFGYLARRVTVIDSTGWMGNIAGGLAFTIVTALISTPLLIALLGTMLATKHRRRFIIALPVTLALLTVAATGITIAMGGQFSEAMQLLQIILGYCGAAVVSFWVMKCCGYRLTMNKADQVQVATTMNKVSPRERSTLRALFVLALLFMVLQIPGWHLVKYRRTHALRFEWQRRGVAVAAENGQVIHAVIRGGGLHRNSISNELLEDLCKLPNLSHLRFSGSAITDEQLKLLVKAPSLEILDLERTSIGDAGIQHLVNLDKLRSLKLTGSQVTAAGLQQLKAALPQCDIQPGGGLVQPARVTVPARTKVVEQPPK